MTYQYNEFPLIRIFVIKRAVCNANVHGCAAGCQDRLHRERASYIFQAQREHGVYALKVETPRFYSPNSKRDRILFRLRGNKVRVRRVARV